MRAILYVVTSEKAVRGIERENKITFIVRNDATKQEIKNEIEKEYEQKASKVTTLTTADGKKKAMVSFAKENAAANLAAKLKVI
ncbi:MAG: 50S ribosomal protein L23 [Candidatus Micrarchaeota archaeon]